jgi:alkyl hydroperoxide reductase subunit AhpC
METLRIGDLFPPLTVNTVAGGPMALPDALRFRIGVLVFYRGHW